VPRTARLGELLREIIGDELGRIDDERLELTTVTSVDVDADLNRAIVYFDSLSGEAGDPSVLEAFGQHRIRLQGAIGRQMRARKTPILMFRPDEVIRSAERIDRILRELPQDERAEEGLDHEDLDDEGGGERKGDGATSPEEADDRSS
jgi:ribosome-binding factor A